MKIPSGADLLRFRTDRLIVRVITCKNPFWLLIQLEDVPCGRARRTVGRSHYYGGFTERL